MRMSLVFLFVSFFGLNSAPAMASTLTHVIAGDLFYGTARSPYQDSYRSTFDSSLGTLTSISFDLTIQHVWSFQLYNPTDETRDVSQSFAASYTVSEGPLGSNPYVSWNMLNTGAITLTETALGAREWSEPQNFSFTTSVSSIITDPDLLLARSSEGNSYFSSIRTTSASIWNYFSTTSSLIPSLNDTFELTVSYNYTPAVVPLSPSMAFLLSGLGVLGLWRSRARMKA